MKYILTLLLLLSIANASNNDYSIIINKPFNNALLDVTQDYDRSISAVGFVKTYKKSNTSQGMTYDNPFDYLNSLSNAQGSQMHLVKVDNQANIILEKTANLSKFNKAVALVKTPQNGYFVGGYTLDGLLILAKLDAVGNLIFKKEFGTNNYDRMSNLILLSDGGVLAVGSSTTTRSQKDNMFTTGLGLNDIFLTRFSKDGKKLWSKKYGTEYDDKGIDAVEANDGSIIVLSQTRYDKYKNITLMRITQTGEKIWLTHYKQKTVITPQRVIKLRDGNFLTSLAKHDDMNKEQIRLIKFDLQKNIILDKEIYTTYASVLTDIKEYSNSNIIGVGYVKDTYNTDALAMILNQDLNMLKQEHFGDENYDAFNSVTILHNSKAIAVGVNTSSSSQESNMWLVKLNKDLTKAQAAPKSINFYKELCDIFKEEIYNKKIIVKEDLTIEFIANNLYFDVGEYKLTKEQKMFLKNFSAKLLPFLYHNKEAIDTIEINGHTSSEWGGANFSSSFLKNEKLSMNRSYSTLTYIFINEDEKTKRWLSNIIKGSGLGFSKKIVYDKIEYKAKSRRVSFKILLL